MPISYANVMGISYTDVMGIFSAVASNTYLHTFRLDVMANLFDFRSCAEKALEVLSSNYTLTNIVFYDCKALQAEQFLPIRDRNIFFKNQQRFAAVKAIPADLLSSEEPPKKKMKLEGDATK